MLLGLLLLLLLLLLMRHPLVESQRHLGRDLRQRNILMTGQPIVRLLLALTVRSQLGLQWRRGSLDGIGADVGSLWVR